MNEADQTRPNPFPITKNTVEIYAEKTFIVNTSDSSLSKYR